MFAEPLLEPSLPARAQTKGGQCWKLEGKWACKRSSPEILLPRNREPEALTSYRGLIYHRKSTLEQTIRS